MWCLTRPVHHLDLTNSWSMYSHWGLPAPIGAATPCGTITTKEKKRGLEDHSSSILCRPPLWALLLHYFIVRLFFFLVYCLLGPLSSVTPSLLPVSLVVAIEDEEKTQRRGRNCQKNKFKSPHLSFLLHSLALLHNIHRKEDNKKVDPPKSPSKDD